MAEVSQLAGKSLAIIGAAGGIGLGLVRGASEAGAEVHAIGRSADRLASIPGGLAGRVVLDLEDPDTWQAAIDSLPPLDGLVFCSGKLDVSPFRTTSPAKFAEAMNINVNAPAMLLRTLLRAGRIKAGCSVVFIGSIAGIRAAVGHVAYATGKAALHGLVRTLALELAAQRVRVNMVSPGLVLAGMGAAIKDAITDDQLAEYAKRYPLGLGKPDDVSGPVNFLLSGASGWITGQDIVADGGATLA